MIVFIVLLLIVCIIIVYISHRDDKRANLERRVKALEDIIKHLLNQTKS